LDPDASTLPGVIAPLRWSEGAVELLDQTSLPAAELWLRCERVEELASAIARLAIRGAPALGVAGAYGIALAAADGPAAGAVERAEHAAELLSGTRPTAVNLHTAVAGGLAAARAAEQGDAAAAALEFARGYERDALAAERALSDFGAELFESGDRALTHCNTGGLATAGVGTALGVIEAAHAAQRLGSVWVKETRPLLQGARLTAWELRRAGIPHSLLADGAVGALFNDGAVERVVVGADRIAANGDVANKVGTYPIAVLADRHAVPFYVAAPTTTIDHDTATGADIPIERRAPEEVTTLAGVEIAPAGTEAANFAFDVTPAELVTAIITERGVLRPPYGASLQAARP
jgi:methylthioribose-1-phosphate isomerase